MRRILAALTIGALLTTLIASDASARTVRPWLGWTTNTLADTAYTERVLGVAPAALSTYAPFDQPFPQEWADAASRRHVPLVIAWEPWNWHLPPNVDQPTYALSEVANGAHDAYMIEWARAARSSGTTVFLRFAPEMNGDWTTWSRNSTPADFVSAWRRAHDLFAQVGATNVRWVFNPSVVYDGSRAISDFWPGREYVDWLGVDGYNWLGVLPGRTYETVDQVFSATISQLRRLAPDVPVMIAECGAGPAAKDRWIPDLVRTAPRLGVRIVVWFEHDKETDWRLTTAHLRTPLATQLKREGWRMPAAPL